jgi:hypothetical protein
MPGCGLVDGGISAGSVKYISDACGELLEGEGFGDQLNPRIQPALVHDRVA